MTYRSRLFSTGGNSAKGRPATSSNAVATHESTWKPKDVVIKTAAGGEVVIPGRATAGLSTEYLARLEERARKGAELPVIWSNPGSHAQLDRVPEAVIQALPPPTRPMQPMKESELTWRYVRSFSFGLAFVALALYLHLKATVSGDARLQLERNSPALAAVLVKMGLLQDLSHVAADMDRTAAFQRLFRRYVPEGSSSMPASRARKMVAALLDLPADDASVVAAFNAAGVSDATNARVSESEFVQLLTAAASDMRDVVLALSLSEAFHISPANTEVIAAFQQLYNELVSARPAGRVFTVEALVDLSRDLGFAADAALAQAFVQDASAVVTRAGSTVAVDAGSSAGVALTAAEFADYLAASAAGAGLSGEAVLQYLQVFHLLHMSGLRESAGVASVASRA